MARTPRTHVWIVLATALSMLTMTMPAMATHNSVGTQGGFYVPDGVDEDGEPIPKTSPELEAQYHTGAHEDGLIPEPRSSPPDQTGQAYTGDCTRYGDDPVSYEQALTELEDIDEPQDEGICYVGYLDAGPLAIMAFHHLLVKQPSDALYNVNPDDDYCEGSERTNDEDRTLPPLDDGGPIDQTVANIERVNHEECQGDGHPRYLPGSVLMDSALFEAPLHDDGTTPGLSEDQANSPRTLPMLTQPYALLLGQPHPANEEPSQLEAGEGVFSGFPGALSEGSISPFIGDLDGVCGDRTQECKLLTPEDVRLYDTNRPDVEGDDGQARFCEFKPQFGTINPDGRQAGLCGISGNVMNQFLGDEVAGGLGIEEAPDTWLNLLPGWYRGVVSISTAGTGPLAGFGNSYLSDDTDFEKGYHYYYAVNPEVPTGDHPLWCAVPNMLAEGDKDRIAEGEDPGFYGEYQADAIAYNLHPWGLHGELQTVQDATHQPVRDAVTAANDLVDQLTDPDDLPDLPELPGTPEAVDELVEEAFDTTNEGIDRAWPFAPGWEKPYNAPNQTQNDFDVALDPGLACNPAGQPTVTGGAELAGGLVFDAGVSQSTITLRDPTTFDDTGLPERQSESPRGTWQADSYSFSGMVKGIVDTSEDWTFSDCPTPDGTVPTNADTCVWEPYWDAYNPQCTTFGGEDCDVQLENLGYAVDPSAGEYEAADGIGGVGLFFALQVSGTVLVTDTSPSSTQIVDGTFEERTALLGSNDPMGTHCVIGTSTGFAEYLLLHITGETDEQAWQDVAETFCPDHDGAVHVVGDAFSNQGSTARGQFSGDTNWVVATPSPDAVSSAMDDFAAEDRLCVGGIWSIQEGITVTTDTTDDLEHGPGDSPVNYGECLGLSTGSSANHAWAALS